MPSKTLKRILRGGMAGAHGYVRGKIGAAQEEEERRQERNQALVDWLTTESQIKTGKAQQAYYERGHRSEPPKPMKEADVLGVLLQKAVETGNWTDYERAKSVGKIPKEPKRPANITGIPDYESLVSERKGIAEKERGKAAETIISAFPNLFLGDEGLPLSLTKSQPPEALAGTVRGSVDPTIRKGGWPIIGGGEEVPNPELAAIDSLLSMIPIPGKYERPTGTGAVALADSIEAARTDPTVAAALMDFMPQRKGEVAPEEDPELTKAKNKLLIGEWDQAKFDRFMKWYEGQKSAGAR